MSGGSVPPPFSFGTSFATSANSGSATSFSSLFSCPTASTSASASSFSFGAANSGISFPTFTNPQRQASPNRKTSTATATPVNEMAENPKTGLQNTEDDLKNRTGFLSHFVMAFKERIHTDIKLKPKNGPFISAHKALLAARSEVFKNMLESDSCKAPPSDTDVITLSELNTEELESFLEFLYTGNLPLDKWKKHVYSLYAAADKYAISYLQDSCERNMLTSLNTSNALDILGISDAHSSKKLKETALKFIVQNIKAVVSSQKYEDFASSNPHVCLQITRAFVDAKCP